MPDLHVEKTGFDGCYKALKQLSSELYEKTFTLEASEDTSLMAEKERECYEELLAMITALADLADTTAADVMLIKERFVSADK